MTVADVPKLWLPPRPAIIRPSREVWRPPVHYRTRSAMLPGLASIIVASGPPAPASVTYRTTRTSITNSASYSFTSTDLGVQGVERTIACVCMAAAVSDPENVALATIAGATATVLSLGGVPGVAIIYVDDPLGELPASGTIGLTMSGAVNSMACSVFDIRRSYQGNGGLIDYNAGSAITTTDAVATDVEIVDEGILIAGVVGHQVGTFTGTWNGTDTPTEHVDATLEAASTYAAWSMTTNESNATRDFTFALSVSGTKRGIAASWR